MSVVLGELVIQILAIFFCFLGAPIIGVITLMMICANQEMKKPKLPYYDWGPEGKGRRNV